MKAWRLTEWKSDPVLVDLERPRPATGEVLVRVGGSGACHSDLHLMHEFGHDVVPWGPPFTLGHEVAGWIEELGPGTEDGIELEPGHPVAVYGPWGCGRCERCLPGAENYCEQPAHAPMPGGGLGLGADGGMAEFVLVPAARHLVPLPDGLTPAVAAPLTDAALTPYHAIRRSWPKLLPGSTAVVIGVGGLGHMALQILAATTAARVIAVDTRSEALELALKNGATLALPADAAAADAIRRSTGGRGADAVFDCVGSNDTLAMGAAAGRTLGDLTVIGLAGGTLPVGFFGVPYELSVQTTYWGTRPELVEVLGLAARGLLRTEITTFPLDRALDAYRQLEKGGLVGRAVVIPQIGERG